MGTLSLDAEGEGETYVYLNGGTLLGQAPLRNIPVPAGRQNLLVWTPSVGGRECRTVTILAGAETFLAVRIRHRDSFPEGGSR